MNFVKYFPSVSLQPFVKNYWMFDVSSEDVPFSQLFFPYGSFELIFYLKGDVRMKYSGEPGGFTQEKSFYSGQFTRSFELEFSEPCKCAGVSFYPWVGNLLFGIPAQVFTDQMIPVHSIDKNNQLYRELLIAKNNNELFHKLERFLQTKLKGMNDDEMVSSITKCIIDNPVNEEMNSFIEKNIGLSRRRIQQRFLDSTGLPMIGFIRKVRFQKSLHAIRKLHADFTLTQIGFDSGYYDQAHFIREFKSFAGITPNQFVKQNSEMKEFIQSLAIS